MRKRRPIRNSPQIHTAPDGDRAAEILLQISVQDDIATEAMKARSFTAAVSASRVSGSLRSELHQLRETRTAMADPDPVARLQRLAKLAHGTGSHTAGQKLTSHAAELEMQIATLQLEAEREHLAGATDGDLVEMLIDVVSELTTDQARQLRQALSARPDRLAVFADEPGVLTMDAEA